MAEKSDGAVRKKELLEQLAGELDRVDSGLMLPWKDAYPHARAFVLGRQAEHFHLPAGRIVLQRTPREIRVSNQILRFGYEAVYLDVDLDSALERFDNDLDCNTVPWTPTYQEGQRLQREQDKGG